MEKGHLKQPEEPWRVLEFYSGIGGMWYKLSILMTKQTTFTSTILATVHISEVLVAVDHPFALLLHDEAVGVARVFQSLLYEGNIQSLTAADINSYQAHVWLLSPPCQPYTRQGLQKQSGDARAFSFLKILELMLQTSQPPVMLLVENVVGFETSDTHTKMLEILERTDFSTQEFILSPTQFGVPYSRPRYFCLAKRRPLSFQKQLYDNQLLWSPSPLFGNDIDSEINENHQSQESSDKLLLSCEPICRFLDHSGHHTESSYSYASSIHREDGMRKTKDVIEQEIGSFDQYLVPSSLIERWGSAMDIVYPDSRRCCCFTKSYYRYVKGTGSLLAPFEAQKMGKAHSLKEQQLRYFTPREVANLHSFPEDFQFPQHIGLRQRYALLGNSLSIAVVAPLLIYLFAEPS